HPAAGEDPCSLRPRCFHPSSSAAPNWARGGVPWYLSFAKTVSGSLDGHSGLSDWFKTLGARARLAGSGLFRLLTLPAAPRRSGITESGPESPCRGSVRLRSGARVRRHPPRFPCRGRDRQYELEG